jgi:hypothetical protein
VALKKLIGDGVFDGRHNVADHGNKAPSAATFYLAA